MQIVTPMPQFLAYRETRTRGKAASCNSWICLELGLAIGNAPHAPQAVGKSHQICKIHHNFRATAGFKQARARPVSPTDITPQRAHHSNGRCATLRSETKCKRYRGSHPLAVVPVRTEKGVPGDGDALLLFQACKVSTVVAPASRGTFAQNRCQRDARRYRSQSFKVQVGQTPGIHLKSAGLAYSQFESLTP
jgi:hypothetical protein